MSISAKAFFISLIGESKDIIVKKLLSWVETGAGPGLLLLSLRTCLDLILIQAFSFVTVKLLVDTLEAMLDLGFLFVFGG